jgi:hypothetical protein
MSQIALPLSAAMGGPERIVVGKANAAVFDACRVASEWPFRTAILAGPPRSGKSLIARWFVTEGLGEAIDDAHRLDETELFHRWNRAQEANTPLLIVNGDTGPWDIALPDLRSRLGAALHLEIAAPDDAMIAELIAHHAAARGLALGPDSTNYLVSRAERSHVGIERLVATIDRLSLERMVPPTLGVWRDALEEIEGPREPRLL